jgi:hypothetical protein
MPVGSVATGFAFGSRGFRGSAIAGLAFNPLKAIGRSMQDSTSTARGRRGGGGTLHTE